MLLRKNALLFFTLCSSSCFFAQSNIVASGGNASGTGGSVSYSIGQIDYTSSSGTTGTLNQGVQQPYEFYALNGINEIGGSFSLILGPNPTTNELILSVSDYAENDLEYWLSDMNGKLIIAKTSLSTSAVVNLENCAPGMYHLYISNKNKQLNSYKIIKH